MSQILYTGDDWVVVGTLNNTTLSYTLTQEIEVKVIVNGRPVLTLTKTGGQITPTMQAKQFQYTVPKAETEKFKCGTVAFQLSITANGNRQTNTSGEIILKDRK